MKLNEIARRISAFTGEDFTHRGELLKAALTRAAQTAYRDLRPMGMVKFFATGSLPSSKTERLVFKGEGEKTISLSGKAYSMRLWGSGTYTQSEKGNYKRVDFYSDGERFADFIRTGTVTLTFSGDSAFTVTDIVSYSEVYGDMIYNIPDGSAYQTFDIRGMAGDFFTFDGPPKDANGNDIKNATFLDGVLVLPADFSGEVTVLYRRLPPLIFADDMEEHVDIPDDLLVPVATLGASYLCLEDNPELSAKLQAIYDGDVRVMASAYRQSPPEYVRTNGWA